jgi:hypothetical protein
MGEPHACHDPRGERVTEPRCKLSLVSSADLGQAVHPPRMDLDLRYPFVVHLRQPGQRSYMVKRPTVSVSDVVSATKLRPTGGQVATPSMRQGNAQPNATPLRDLHNARQGYRIPALRNWQMWHRPRDSICRCARQS